jgi:hypothetical protein
MPTFDKAVLTEQARRLGFLTAPFEKMTRLTEILRFLNDSDELRESLAIKGGTAINLTVFNLPRLSVDIDLDFTVNLSREETRRSRDRISELLGMYMTAEGYTNYCISFNFMVKSFFGDKDYVTWNISTPITDRVVNVPFLFGANRF